MARVTQMGSVVTMGPVAVPAGPELGRTPGEQPEQNEPGDLEQMEALAGHRFAAGADIEDRGGHRRAREGRDHGEHGGGPVGP